MTIKLFWKGAVVRVSAAFADADGQPVDPNTVQLEYRVGSGDVTRWVHGTDSELVKDDVGEYHADIPAATPGRYYWRWESTGTGQAAEEGEFEVAQSRFD